MMVPMAPVALHQSGHVVGVSTFTLAVARRFVIVRNGKVAWADPVTRAIGPMIDTSACQ